MREVERSRFVPAAPSVVERHLDPRSLIEYEGSFRVREVVETDDGTAVTAVGGGLELTLQFETGDGNVHYTQAGDAGPFESMETWVTVAPENEGSRVTMRSAVSLGLALPAVTDRVAAWKRGGELERALDALEAAVS
jgi:hypothetical protein